MTPFENDFWFLPLGGCGEIGMNLNLYGHNHKWLMVDCGITFEDNKIVMPDPEFIETRRDSLVGIIATHAHEDHIGALPDLWQRFKVPIYTTPFTAHVIQRKFAERRIPDVSITVVESGETLRIGPFNVRWLPITHSTPETNALVIETPVGRVLHTADWKIDENPVVGEAFNRDHYRNLAGIDAIVCDSTNATRPGKSISEGDLLPGLRQQVLEAPGRVIVGCFASNVARLQTLARVAVECDRYLGILGRSLTQMSQAAKMCGHLDRHFAPIDPDHLGYLPSSEVMAIASGSQGEVGAALYRLAMDSHPAMNLDPGDRVIFSAKTIPGNEEDVGRLVSRLKDRGVEIIHADEHDTPLHASGHPHQDELREMYQSVKPGLAIPVHGEAEHMAENAAIAASCGVNSQLVGENGDLFVISGARAPQKLARAARVGRITRR